MEPRNLELAKCLRRRLHEHPEVSNHETWTKQHLMDFIKTHTKLEIVDRGKWFYAVYRSGDGRSDENMAFRADFDALPMDEGIALPWSSKIPGVAHKCGHDGHSAALAGFALEVDQKGARKDIFFLFQHAEETGDGAAECVTFIRENDIDEIFAYHNGSGFRVGTVNVIDGTCNCASKGMAIRMEGAPAHASQPEKGANPAYAIAKIINAIPELTSPERNRGMVLCTVIRVDVGERAFGMSASRGELLLTIRAYYEEELGRLQASLEELARAEAERDGLKVSFAYNDVFPVTSNHKESSDKIRMVCREKGLPLLEIPGARRGSEDFGHYLKATKGALCYIGNGEEHPPVHTYGYDFPDGIIETAVELFKGLAGVRP